MGLDIIRLYIIIFYLKMARKKNKNCKKNLNQREGMWMHQHTHTLVDDDMDVCSDCLMIFYNGGEVRKFETFEETEKYVCILQSYLDEVKKIGEKYRAKVLYREFDLDMTSFQNNINSIIENLNQAKENEDLNQYSKIKNDCLKLKAKFESSQLMAVVSRLKFQTQMMNKLIFIPDSDSESDEEVRQREMILKAKEIFARKYEKEIKKVKDKANAEIDNLKQLIEEYDSKLKDSEEEIKRLSDEHSKSTEETKNLNENFIKWKDLLMKTKKEKDILKESKFRKIRYF